MKERYNGFIGTLMLLFVFFAAQPGNAQRLDPLTKDSRQHSLKTNKNAETKVLHLPFFDDFSSYLGAPDTNRYEVNGGAFVNRQFAVNPPSFGVATFDGLDANGEPYNSSDPSATGKTDELTSLEIDLSMYDAADSIYFSFYYQPTGVGHIQPSPGDSLKLYFKDTLDVWQQQWTMAVDSVEDFKKEMIVLTDSAFFHESFQFKFESYGNKSGMYDVWNVDYIYMNKNRPESDKDFRDFAISTIPNSYLKTYTAMPYNQFLEDPGGSVNDSVMVRINGLNVGFPVPLELQIDLAEVLSDSVQTLFTANPTVAADVQQYLLSSETNALDIFQYDDGMVLESRFSLDANDPEKGDTVTLYPVTADTVITQTDTLFLEPGDELYLNGQWNRLEEGSNLTLVAGDTICFNSDTFEVSEATTLIPTGKKYLVTTTYSDAITRTCDLTDYFAYDDGTAEKTFVMDEQWGMVAYRFDLNKDDILLGVEINFPVTAKGVDGESIDLVVWQDIEDIPSGSGNVDSILHSEPIAAYVAETMNEFTTIRYTSSIPVSDHFYIGWQVTGQEEVHVGFDANESSHGNLYVRMADSWSEFLYDGALMIRPIMNSLDRFAGVDSPNDANQFGSILEIFPNPTTGEVFLKNRMEEVVLMNQLGETVATYGQISSFDISHLESGIYIVQGRSNGGFTQRAKVVLTH